MSRRIAVIEAGRVTNIIVADSWPGGVDITEAHQRPDIGWHYRDGEFFAPEPQPEPDSPTLTTTLMTHLAFLSRLTIAEHVAIEEAMPTSALLRVAKQRFDAARDIDVAAEDTRQFVMLLAQSGFITESRATDMLQPIPLAQRGAINPTTLEVTP